MSERCIVIATAFSDCENGIENEVLLKPQIPEMALRRNSSGAGLCRCDEAAGETGKEDLCQIPPGE